MTEAIPFYIDFKSPFAFLAVAPARLLECDFDVALDWRPYTLDIPSYLDAVDGRSEHNWRKIRYSYMDARRLANKAGLTIRGPQKIFDSSIGSIGLLFARDKPGFDRYVDLMFERFFRRELDIECADAVTAVLREAGVDIAGWTEFLAGEGRVLHDRQRRETEAAGVFGVPSFMLRGELFWGGDRIPLLRERLAELGLARVARSA